MGEVGIEMFGQGASDASIGDGNRLELVHVPKNNIKTTSIDRNISDGEISEINKAREPHTS